MGKERERPIFKHLGGGGLWGDSGRASLVPSLMFHARDDRIAK